MSLQNNLGKDEIVSPHDPDIRVDSQANTSSHPGLFIVSSPHRDGTDGDASVELPDSQRSETPKDVPSLPPLILNSFVPVIEKLPGLILENNIYHIDVPISCGDLEELTFFAQRVEELCLTDTTHDQDLEVSADTITRLAIALRGTDNPLFPRLKRLRLEGADSQLSFLWFCVTPSLETLEVVEIPENRQITVSGFFKELLLSALGLANIILGPGQISASVLQSSAQFAHLRQLKIVDAATSVDYGFLQAVAALRNLEIFHIDARSATYTPYTVPVTAIAATEYVVDGKDLLGEDSSIPEDTFQDPSSHSGQSAVPFPQLKTMTAICNVLLISDLIHHLFPCEIKQISLTLVRGTFLSVPERRLDVTTSVPSAKLGSVAISQPNSERKTALGSEPVPAETRVGDPGPFGGENRHSIPGWRRKGESRFCKGYSHPNYDEACEECRKIKTERLKYEEEKDRLLLVSNTLSQNTYFASLIEEILLSGTVTEIFLDCIDIQSPTSTKATLSPPKLPSNTFNKLLSYPCLETLDIKHWALHSVNRSLWSVPYSIPLSRLEHPLAMKRLCLPIDSSLNSGISELSTFARVADCYPGLLQLQCRIALSSRLAVPDLVISGGISHGLKELTIGGGSPISTTNKLAIAPFISFLFPYLETIATPGYGQEAEDWGSIYELVKMCWKVRHAEKSLQQ